MWLAWRLTKFGALALFVAGVVGASAGSSRADRLRALFALATPACVALLCAGWALMRATDRSLGEVWLLGGVVAAFVALHGATQSAFAEGRSYGPAAGLGGLLAGVALMVLRPTEASLALAYGGAGLLVGVVAATAWGRAVPDDNDARDAVVRGLRLWARVEAISVIALFAGMAWRGATGDAVDGGTGLLGWTHGVLVIVWFQMLSACGRFLGWSWTRKLTAAALAMLPGGTLVTERWLREDPVRG